MTREELEHIIRASGAITNQYQFVIVGSQALLGSVPWPQEVFRACSRSPRGCAGAESGGLRCCKSSQ